MGDKGGKKNKVKNQKQQEQRAKGKEQRPVDKGRPPVAAPLVRPAL